MDCRSSIAWWLLSSCGTMMRNSILQRDPHTAACLHSYSCVLFLSLPSFQRPSRLNQRLSHRSATPAPLINNNLLRIFYKGLYIKWLTLRPRPFLSFYGVSTMQVICLLEGFNPQYTCWPLGNPCGIEGLRARTAFGGRLVRAWSTIDLFFCDGEQATDSTQTHQPPTQKKTHTPPSRPKATSNLQEENRPRNFESGQADRGPRSSWR